MHLWGYETEGAMLEELERIAAQQSARYAGAASATDLDDLRQEGVAEMLSVIHTKEQPKIPGAYLSGVCKRAMANWWREFRSQDIAVYDEELHSTGEAVDAEGDIDKARVWERLQRRVKQG